MSIYRTAGPVERGDLVVFDRRPGWVRPYAAPGSRTHLEWLLRGVCSDLLRVDPERMAVRNGGPGRVLVHVAGRLSPPLCELVADAVREHLPAHAEVEVLTHPGLTKVPA